MTRRCKNITKQAILVMELKLYCLYPHNLPRITDAIMAIFKHPKSMERRYISLIRITLVVLYLVIVAGSVVRMTGSGMGCPDWPKCFGKWIPPMDESELPANYKEIYSKKRQVKIENFASLLEKIGFNEVAQSLRDDKTLLAEEEFNAAKTWTEYVNRLVGFTSGILMLIMVIFSLFFWKRHKLWFYLSFVNLLLIALTAWLGAVVVATNLLPWVITVHMMLAVLLIIIQVNLLTKVSRPRFKMGVRGGYRFMLFISILLVLTQIVIGTQVRQEIDVIAGEHGEVERASWIDHTSWVFMLHRSFSILLFIISLLLFYFNYSRRYGISLINLNLVLMLLVIGTGISLNYLGMPQIAQPTHLVLACILVGLQFYIFFRTTKVRR